MVKLNLVRGQDNSLPTDATLNHYCELYLIVKRRILGNSFKVKYSISKNVGHLLTSTYFADHVLGDSAGDKADG